MLDAPSLDQLRTFIAAADEGSFSAAGRRLRRAQSVVSQTLANLEQTVGLKLFDRSTRYPRLTDAGRALLIEARAVVRGADGFKARARELSGGLESELSVAVDVMFPMAVLTAAVGEFRSKFAGTPLRLHVEVLGAVVQPVLDGACRVGIVGSLPLERDPRLDTVRLLDVPMVPVVAPNHPLARLPGRITGRQLSEHVQLVLTDRSSLTEGRDFGVLSAQTWRLADLGAKHAFLRAGFGWGNMPLDLVADDLKAGRLVRIRPEGVPSTMGLTMFAVHRPDAPPGPAGRWFVERLGRPVARASG